MQSSDMFDPGSQLAFSRMLGECVPSIVSSVAPSSVPSSFPIPDSSLFRTGLVQLGESSPRLSPWVMGGIVLAGLALGGAIACLSRANWGHSTGDDTTPDQCSADNAHLPIVSNAAGSVTSNPEISTPALSAALPGTPLVVSTLQLANFRVCDSVVDGAMQGSAHQEATTNPAQFARRLSERLSELSGAETNNEVSEASTLDASASSIVSSTVKNVDNTEVAHPLTHPAVEVESIQPPFHQHQHQQKQREISLNQQVRTDAAITLKSQGAHVSRLDAINRPRQARNIDLANKQAVGIAGRKASLKCRAQIAQGRAETLANLRERVSAARARQSVRSTGHVNTANALT